MQSNSPLNANPTAAQDLFSITPSYLLPRHALSPPLDTKLRVSPAYAEAPSTGNITICYTHLAPEPSPGRLTAPTLQLVRCSCAIIRDGLISYNGYEVRENGGNFLLAFGRATDALAFCCAMQLAFMHVRICFCRPSCA
jgi:hypothetical protein